VKPPKVLVDDLPTRMLTGYGYGLLTGFAESITRKNEGFFGDLNLKALSNEANKENAGGVTTSDVICDVCNADAGKEENSVPCGGKASKDDADDIEHNGKRASTAATGHLRSLGGVEDVPIDDDAQFAPSTSSRSFPFLCSLWPSWFGGGTGSVSPIPQPLPLARGMSELSEEFNNPTDVSPISAAISAA
ncbi:unnamed protein product, partial [Polarella glacialis]